MCAFPSEDQALVINHRGRPLVVVAGPGTGKTAAIVARMIGLLSDDANRPVSFVTFTRASRRDTDKKLREALSDRAVKAAEGDLPRVSTLHTFAKALVHRYVMKYGRDTSFTVLIADQGERTLLVSDLVEDMGLAIDPPVLEEAIVRHRATGRWPGNVALPEHDRSRVLEAFNSLLKVYNTFDMEGLVVTACHILSDVGADLPPIFLQVDEYQDLNLKDHELVGLASAAPSSEVVVVGDDAQSIYGRRYANPEGIRELWNSSDWESVPFRKCHRLPTHVLLAAQALIANRGYLGAQVDLPEDDGKRVLTLQCTTEPVETGAVACHILNLLDNGADGSVISPRDVLILCPTNSRADRMSRELSQSYGIPTRQRPSRSIPADIWRLALVLRMLRSDGLALRQWLPPAGVQPHPIGQVRSHALCADQSFYQSCAESDDTRIAGVIRAVADLRDALIDPARFNDALAGFPGLDPAVPANRVIGEIVEFVPSVDAMIAYVHKQHGVVEGALEGGEESDADQVLVTTMHGAKGLEAEIVLVTTLDDRFMPAPGRNLEEQERILYVALTRAKQDVVLTFHERYDRAARRRLRAEAMSPLLVRIRGHLDVRRVTAGALNSVRQRFLSTPP